MKTITICGSFKYKDTMLLIAEKLTLQGNLVITPNFPTRDNYSDEEIHIFNMTHKEKIKMSDAVFIVNVDGYIGKATQSEIALATKLNKEIIYYTDKA